MKFACSIALTLAIALTPVFSSLVYAADVITGLARVVDGDTLTMGQCYMRLRGIAGIFTGSQIQGPRTVHR